MKKILFILLFFVSFSLMAQNKYFKESAARIRLHKITSWKIDTVKTEIKYYAHFTIYFGGIDGEYNEEIPKAYYEYNNDCIMYLSILPKFSKYVIITE